MNIYFFLIVDTVCEEWGPSELREGGREVCDPVPGQAGDVRKQPGFFQRENKHKCSFGGFIGVFVITPYLLQNYNSKHVGLSFFTSTLDRDGAYFASAWIRIIYNYPLILIRFYREEMRSGPRQHNDQYIQLVNTATSSIMLQC